MILVTGSSGTVGSAIVQALGGRHDVLTVVRDPEASGRARSFDFAEPKSWRPALAGVRSLFLMLPPGLPQARQRFRGVLAEAREAGVERIVFLSIRNADRLGFLPHRGLELEIEASGIPWTHLRPNDFMQNFVTQPLYRRDIARGELWAPGGRSVTSYIDARDVGAVGAAALLGGFERRALPLTGASELTHFDVAAALTRALGWRVRNREPSLPRFFVHAVRGGAPAPLALVMTSIGLIARLGYAAGVDPGVEEVLGRAPRSFAEFASEFSHRWAAERACA